MIHGKVQEWPCYTSAYLYPSWCMLANHMLESWGADGGMVGKSLTSGVKVAWPRAEGNELNQNSHWNHIGQNLLVD